MRATTSLTLTLLAALILSGCTSAGDTAQGSGRSKLVGRGAIATETLHISADWPELALPTEKGHNHLDRSQHQNLSTPNFEVLGYDPLITDYYGRTAGDHGCGDTQERNGRRLSITHSFGTDVAFVLIDTTDANHPRKIGEMVMAFTQVYDLALSPDLHWIVLATSPMDAGPSQPDDNQPLKTRYERNDMLWRDACTGATTPMGPEAGLPYASGNVLVDISNPFAPNVADFLFWPTLGAHSVSITDMNGRLIVLSSVPNIPDQASFYAFMEITQLPTGSGKLMPLSFYQFPGATTGPLATTGGMHDGVIAKHPITGQWIAYLAYGDTGLVTLNVNDPRNPVLLARWNQWSAVGQNAPTAPYIHEALPAPEAWEGHHYTWIGEECVDHPAHNPTCLVFGLDTTDPAKPTFVGAWTLPIDVQWSRGLEFSLHYLAIVNRTLFATAYHGGVWAIDVSTPEARVTMPSIGVFIPSIESPKHFTTPPRGAIVKALYGGYALDDAPVVLDLNPTTDGNLIVFDMQSGAYSVRFDASRPAPAPEPWPLGHLNLK